MAGSSATRLSVIYLAFWSLGAVSNGFAQTATWEGKVADLRASAKQEKVDVSFRFKNAGVTPVTIVSLKPGCDCTTTELAKKDYAPGESGEIKASVKLNGQAGLLEKTITVTTSDTTAPPTILTIRITIPDLVEIEPRLLTWSAGGPTSEKTVDVFFATDPPMTLTRAVADSSSFDVRIEILDATRRYRLHVTPKATEHAAPVAIRLETRAGDNEPMSVNVYAQVR